VPDYSLLQALKPARWVSDRRPVSDSQSVVSVFRWRWIQSSQTECRTTDCTVRF